jgi:hypothetical protein
MAAALLLPGIAPLVHSETAPEQGVIATKVLDYQDRQPGLERTHVRAPSAYLLLPFEGKWSLEASAVSDAVSGASPRYHTAISSASRQTEKRRAADAKVTLYESRYSLNAGALVSDEHDFHSQAVSAGGSASSEDNNTTVTFGLAYTRDRIGATGNPSLNERRRTSQVSLGLSQNVTARDLLQTSLVLTRGTGFFDDPYKSLDHRPDFRNQGAALVRWNHYIQGLAAAVRSGYRYYADSFGIRAHTFDIEWAQALGDQFRLTPGVRYYTQRAASFYFDPVYDPTLGPPFPPGWQPGMLSSADQRLSSFGAIDLSLKLEWTFAKAWTADFKVDAYRQRANWRIGGRGSPGLAPFDARWIQAGLSYRF